MRVLASAAAVNKASNRTTMILRGMFAPVKEAPEREYDGRRCHVHFANAAGAKTYDVWVSTYADGRGAVLLGKDWTAPGQLLTGLSPNIDLYLFVVAKDPAGKSSRPGKGFKVNLKDMFPQR